MGNPPGIEDVGGGGESQPLRCKRVIAGVFCTDEKLLSVADRERRAGRHYRQV
jgi:hypothetical protein